MAFKWKFWEKAPAQPDKPDSAAPPTKAPEGVNPEDLKGLPKKLARFLMSPQGAEAAKKLKEVMERMKADGVDVKNEAAVKAWLEEHKTELQGEAPPAVPTFIRSEAKVGRNDPCPCGSGKKFKKCHEAKAAA